MAADCLPPNLSLGSGEGAICSPCGETFGVAKLPGVSPPVRSGELGVVEHAAKIANNGKVKKDGFTVRTSWHGGNLPNNLSQP